MTVVLPSLYPIEALETITTEKVEAVSKTRLMEPFRHLYADFSLIRPYIAHFEEGIRKEKDGQTDQVLVIANMQVGLKVV